MKNLTTQFEIRYTHILNFSTAYKELVTPYLALCDFSVSNANTLEEFIVMRFDKEGYLIDFRWDRLILLSEGERNDLKKPQGPFFIYFQLFSELKSLKTFGKVINAVLSETALNEDEGNLILIKKKFKETFFLPNYALKYEDFDEDYSITTEFEKNGKRLQVMFGPFDYKKDVATHGLSPIYRKKPESFESLRGIFFNSLYFEPLLTVDFDTYKRFTKIINSTCATIKF